jgi:hypothetical protein
MAADYPKRQTLSSSEHTFSKAFCRVNNNQPPPAVIPQKVMHDGGGIWKKATSASVPDLPVSGISVKVPSSAAVEKVVVRA